MEIIMTAEEIQDEGVWEEACELLGINPYAVNEGLMEPRERIELTEDQARKLGLLT